MKHAPAFVLFLALATCARAERVLVDADFSAGTLPAGWTDNTSPDAAATYEPVKLDRSTATRLTPVRGQFQLSTPLPRDAAQSDSFYRLVVTGRSVSRGVLQLALRPADGSPRKLTWSARRELLEVPSDVSAVFQLPKQPTPLSLLLTLPTDDSVDLAHVKLVEITRAELVAQMKKDFPKGGTAQNLLRVSRFPNGVESGGAIGRERSDEQYEIGGDPDVIGPSGSPALGLKCEQPLRFLLPPVAIPWTFAKHTASVYVRGHGSGSLGVLGDGSPVASQPFSVDSDDWQRVTLTFDPVLLARQHQLVLDTTGTIRADAFQLEPGKKATEYVQRPEVSLSLPNTDASVARIQFDDDPAVVNFTVTRGDNNVLNARVVNIYGDQRRLPDVSLVRDQISRGSLPYEVFDGKSYGVFRIEAWLEDTNGRTVSPVNEIVVTRVPRARAWDQDAPDSMFGAHLGPTHRQMVLAKAVGINWARLHDAGVDAVGWSFVEPTQGQWTWRDDNIKRYRDHHLSLLGTLQQSPGWASGLGRVADGYWDRYLEPVDTAAWDNYVRTITTRYKDSIHAWDVWNEPWLRFWSKWDPEKKEIVRSPTAAADYARLEQSTYAAAKSVDPSLTILGLNTTGGGHGSKWTRQVADAGGLAPCDAYSYHSYANETAGFPGDVADRHFHDAFNPLLTQPHTTTEPTTAPTTSPLATSNSQPATGSLDKPIWMTEGSGTNLAITRGFYNYSAPGEDPEDTLAVADRLVRYEVSTLAQGAEKLFLYHTNVGGEFHPGPGAFQTLVTDDGYPEPSAAAHAILAWHLEGKHFAKRIEIARGVYASIFVSPTRSVAVLTSATPHDRYVLPRDVIALDLRDLFGNDLPGGSDYNGLTTYIDVQGSLPEIEQVLHHHGTHHTPITTRPTR